MEDGFLCCLEASTVSNRPLDREPLPWQSPQHSREPPHHTESSRHPSHCVYSRKWGMGRDGHKWKWRKHSTEKKLLRVITLKCASRLRPRRLKACAEHCRRWPHFINKNVLTILFYFSLMNAPFNYFEQIITFYKGKIILGDPGADSVNVRLKSKRVGKNGAKKSNEWGGERVGTIFYQTSSKRSRPFWLLIGARNFCVFLPNQRAADLGILLCVLTCKVHEGVSRSPCLSWLFAEALHKEVKRFNVRTKSKGKRSEYLRLSHRLMRWTFRRYQHCLKIKANSANASWTLAWENIRNLAVLPFMLFLGAGKPISNLQNV